MKRWIPLAAAVFSMACLIQGVATPFPEVSPQVGPPVTPTPQCQPAAGVVFEVRPIDIHTLEAPAAELHASGLRPGENVTVLYEASITESGGTSGRGGIISVIADEDGEFFHTRVRLEPLEGETHSTWDIRLIHAGGVECREIILP